MTQKKEGYLFTKIQLIESHFSIRKNNLDKKEKDALDLVPETGYQKKDNLLIIEVSLHIRESMIEAFVKMEGYFKIIKEPLYLPADAFGQINGPAIIYPFVREHIANLTMKGGRPILLPPINFVELARKKALEKAKDE